MMDTAVAAPVARLESDFGVVTGQGSPRRLADDTRRLAARYLSGEYGATMERPAWRCARESFPDHGHEGWVAEVVMRIAREAPLRLLPGERVVGSATYCDALAHVLPGTDHRSVSHTTLDFAGTLMVGYRGLRERIDDGLAAADCDATARDLLLAMRRCIEAAGVWNQRYCQALEERIATSWGADCQRYRQALDNLRVVPEAPPTSFIQGLQALWSLWDFQRLCGNWSGIGRIDAMLGPLLEADLAAGRISLDEAREWLAHFWIHGCEWIQPACDAAGRSVPVHGGSGDAQTYQNVILGGVDADGRDITNAVTYLVLDVVEELHIADFPIAVRVNEQTPAALLERIAAVQQRGGGIVAIYNEALVIAALVDLGYALTEARQFSNDGCWEPIVQGRTAFSYSSCDMLGLLHEVLGVYDEAVVPQAADFEDLYTAFRRRLAAEVEAMQEQRDQPGLGRHRHPAPLVSLLCRGCIERGRGYYDHGPDYTVWAIHAGGLPDTANSLLAIRRLVFEEGRIGLGELVALMRNDWAGAESQRMLWQRELPFYGNDDAVADAMVGRVYDDYTAVVGAVRYRAGTWRPAALSTFGREVGYRSTRGATAFGARRGAILATNMRPTPGTDHAGPTALIRSFCTCDYRRVPSGVALELILDPGSVDGDTGRAVLVGLMRTYLRLGGFFLQIDVVDSALLREAQAHPERFPNLAVRISGWSARFATLDAQWQEMIIQRSMQRSR